MIDILMNPASLREVSKVQLPIHGMNALGQVIVIDAWPVIEQVYGGRDWQEACRIFNEWCAKHGIYYYARPRESFFMNEAYELAFAANCPYLIVEDLS